MDQLQATWHPPGRLFLWVGPDGASSDDADAVAAYDLPELSAWPTSPCEIALADPGPPVRRRRVQGRVAEIADWLSLLPTLRNDEGLSDSLRTWATAAQLALELAVRQAVAPTVRHGQARWRVLLSRREDRERFEAIAAALPPWARARPTRPSGPVRLQTAAVVVRAFMDAIVDHVYRQGAWPGTGRGWALEFANGLRGEDAAFNPRDARSQGIPQKLAAWSGTEGGAGLRVGFSLELPDERGTFVLDPFVHQANRPHPRVDVATAWAAGESLSLGGRDHPHPAFCVMRDMARARRLDRSLARALQGDAPAPIRLAPKEAWAFLDQAVGPLRDAGFEVDLPEAFSAAGNRRIRARMRIEASGEGLHIGEILTYRWEVTLGELVLTGPEFQEILDAAAPIVRFRGEWVLVDPDELARLPEGLPKEGTLGAAEALRAVLTGQHEGVPVVADDRLEMVLDALRRPPDVDPPRALRATLRPYQQRGFSWLTCLGSLGLGACLADDMGLGKTVQLITHLLQRHQRGPEQPSLVVCPTSVLGNWRAELRRFAPSLRVARYHGLHRDLSKARVADVVLTTYGLLARDIDALSAEPWDVVALDEAQAIKNPDSQRALAACRLDARHRVAMSGTPVENRLEEMWSLMRFLVPGLLGTRAHFRRTVAIPVERFGDQEVARRLKLGVSPFLLRRVKTDPTIVDDLPDKVEIKEHCVLTGEQARLYRETAESCLQRIREARSAERRGQVLAMLTALKQICNHPSQYLKETGDPLGGRSGKLQRATELLEAVLDRGDRAIVFTQYREMGDRLQRWLGEALHVEAPFLHGGVTSEGRDEMVRAFQEDADGPPILLISLRAGGTGLNLTRATHVIHYDRWWNPAVEDQATDRAYRIGQHQNVQVHKFVCQGTLEERIDRLLEEKRTLAESVVGSGERLVTELDDAALRALVLLGDDAVAEDE